MIILGLIIALLGFIFEGVVSYLLILFAILTIIFGIMIILKIYHRIKKHKLRGNQVLCANERALTCHLKDILPKNNIKKGRIVADYDQKQDLVISKRYSFFLGVFRGATPCLKMLILTPLILVIDLPLAILLVFVFASTTTVYPVIGFLIANLFTNFKHYDSYVQITGATLLICIGIFTLLNHFFTHGYQLGI